MKAKMVTTWRYDTSEKVYKMALFLSLSTKGGYVNKLMVNPEIELMEEPLSKTWGNYYEDFRTLEVTHSNTNIKKLLQIKKEAISNATEILTKVVKLNKQLISLCPEDSDEVLITDEKAE